MIEVELVVLIPEIDGGKFQRNRGRGGEIGRAHV